MNKELYIAIVAAVEAGDKIMEIYTDPTADFGVERKADNSPLTRADKAAHISIVAALEPLQIPILSEEGKAIDPEERCAWSKLWVVDPLDGTKEFIKRNGDFTVNIALVEGGVPRMGVIYIPVTKSLYFGTEGYGGYKVEDVECGEGAESIIARAIQLPLDNVNRPYRVVASLSHLSPETEEFVANIRAEHNDVEMISRGSSLKICMVAEGVADIYPRFAPTMEWDTAAGDAILRATGGVMIQATSGEAMQYNKLDLLNPYFIAKR